MPEHSSREAGAPPTYLGDGVYASHDGWHIWLRTERLDGVHEIALEPMVLAALLTYAQKIAGDADETDKSAGLGLL